MAQSSPSARAAPRRRSWRRIALALVAAFVVALAVYASIPGRTPAADPDIDRSRHEVIAIFGASGTAGDGVLKAALADGGVAKIHVVTRRATPRIEEGVSAGRVEMIKHMDYEDYTALAEFLPRVDAVYWALGTSASNVSKEQYGVIHVDFPVAFVRAWLASRGEGMLSFHLISGQGASSDAWSNWARDKARAERELAALVEGTRVRVVAYRPSYIAPAQERAHTGHRLLHAVFAPLKLAIRSTAIGQAMLEVTARGPTELPNGTILENKDILRYAAAYRARDE